ncbi:hypothetical protein MPTK1_2g14290 [Marchantia polymorpha subsp. ruderalis]
MPADQSDRGRFWRIRGRIKYLRIGSSAYPRIVGLTLPAAQRSPGPLSSGAAFELRTLPVRSVFLTWIEELCAEDYRK